MADPANRQTNPAGGKYYMHPLTGERFDSVTTILDLVDKSALKQWAANLSTDFVIDNIPQYVAAMLVEPCGNTHNRCWQKHGRDNRCERCPCGSCLPCWRRRAAYRHAFESGRRADEGTECHAAIHHWITTGGGRVEMRPEVRPYFDSFLTWVKDYGLHPNGQPGQGDWEQLEITLLNREHGYAGTSDGAVWIRRGRSAEGDHVVDRIGGPNASQVLVRVDYKTREKPDERMFNDMPMQGVAYERCRTAMLPDGREFEPPHTHARAVLQLRPGAYSFKPMLTDDSTFDAFLGVLATYRWIHGPGKNAFDLDVWAAIPPGVLGAPELSDPWSTDTSDPVVVPFRPNSSAVVTDAQVVPLKTGDELRAEQQLHNSVTWARNAETPIPDPVADLPQKQCGWTEPHEAHEYNVPFNSDDGPYPVAHWCTGVEPPQAPVSAPDPFDKHNAKQQVEADMRRPTRTSRRRTDTATAKEATIDSIRGFLPGAPDQTALDEPIPF